MHRVPMHIIEPGKVAARQGQVGFTEILPAPRATRSAVETIDISGRGTVEVSEKSGQVRRSARAAWRAVADEMIVIGKDRPSLQPPAVFRRQIEQRRLEAIAFGGAIQQVMAIPGASGHEIDASSRQPMGWRVRPVASPVD